jgi:Tol biopolymer transport system component
MVNLSLKPGTRLDHYEIQSPVGAGGMGEVYKATDTRLGRTVALKILPEDLSGDRERRRRFHREARIISSLSHPHICGLYDIGQKDDVYYLVMEYVEGETLTIRLSQGRMSPGEVLHIGSQIASAVHTAHRAGIVHRDLKPANVMLSKNAVKLLDFGLAKEEQSVVAVDAGPSVATRPQSEDELTMQGQLLGTLAYMAPEQLHGRTADTRTDIFALGLILYEMATGVRAFEGDSQASMIASILKEQPKSIKEHHPELSGGLDRVVKACLEKDPDDRIQSAHDVMLQLQWLLARGYEKRAAVAESEPKRPKRWPWLVAAVAVLFLVTWFPKSLQQTAPPGEVVRFTIPPPRGTMFRFTIAEDLLPGPVAVSPDGKRVAFGVLDALGRRELWVRSFDTMEARPLPGGEGGGFPFWSPDSRFIGFFADNKLKKISAEGGVPQSLGDAPESPRGGTWNTDGIIVFAPTQNSSLYRVHEGGGTPVAVTFRDSTVSDLSHRWPHFLPDGKHFLFLSWSNSAVPGDPAYGVFVGSLDSGETKQLMPALSDAAFVLPDHLLYVHERTLMRVSFDAGALEVTGVPTPLDEDIQYDPLIGKAAYSVARNALVYRTGPMVRDAKLLWLNRTGTVLDSVGEIADYRGIRISPDGTKVAAEVADPRLGTTGIWLLDLARGVQTRFTRGATSEWELAWSPDGRRLTYGSDATGLNAFLEEAIDGSTLDPRYLAPSPRHQIPTDWSPDGRLIAFARSSATAATDELWFYSRETGTQTAFRQGDCSFSSARFSPDGRWVAYNSNETGQYEIYVRPLSGSGAQWQVSSDGGTRPRWSRDGRELVYLDRHSRLIAVAVERGDRFEVGASTPLFSLIGEERWDADPDHERFLVSRTVIPVLASPMKVVLHWMAETESR